MPVRVRVRAGKDGTNLNLNPKTEGRREEVRYLLLCTTYLDEEGDDVGGEELTAGTSHEQAAVEPGWICVRVRVPVMNRPQSYLNRCRRIGSK